jgi:acetyltransferase-like isoleucine patch superfamily enzyme
LDDINPEFSSLLEEELSRYLDYARVFPAGLPMERFQAVSFAEACSFADISGSFDSNCTLLIDPMVRERLINGDGLTLTIRHFAKKPDISNATVILANVSGAISINLANDDAIIIFGDQCHGHFDLRVFRNGFFCAGDRTTANGARIIIDKALVVFGSDCLLSDELLIQSSDQHGIIDLTRNEIINDGFNATIVENHVWIGRRATLLPNVRIGAGSIIGACSLVTGDVPSTCIAAGAPARVLKTDRTWSRQPETLDAMTEAFMASLGPRE